MLGDFDSFHDLLPKDSGPSSHFTGFNFLVFALATFLSMILMLNLLISVLSDVFAKVEAMEKNFRNFEKLQIISSIDVVLGGEVSEKLEREFKDSYLFVVKKKIDVETNVNTKKKVENIEKIVILNQ